MSDKICKLRREKWAEDSFSSQAILQNTLVTIRNSYTFTFFVKTFLCFVICLCVCLMCFLKSQSCLSPLTKRTRQYVQISAQRSREKSASKIRDKAWGTKKNANPGFFYLLETKKLDPPPSKSISTINPLHSTLGLKLGGCDISENDPQEYSRYRQ